MRVQAKAGNHLAVLVDGVVVQPDYSLSVRNHSPTGFSWGYGGSGPSQLALAILLHVTDLKTAQQHYMQFKWDHVARWPEGDVDVEIDIEEWLVEQGDR